MKTTEYLLYLESLTIADLYRERNINPELMGNNVFTKKELIDYLLKKQSQYTNKYTDVGFKF